MPEAGGGAGADGSGEMFYSHCLLSRKGPLGTIWTAAHRWRKLRKQQIAETDIPSTIDRIMLAEVPIAFRILAFLLIGVVRIYSKKLEYLYHDCNEAFFRIKNSAIPGKNVLSKEAPRTSVVSIIVPESFELDAFDLEGFEESLLSSPNKDLTHEGLRTEETTCPSMEKMRNYDGKIVHWEDGPSLFMLEDDIVLPDTIDIDLEISNLHHSSDLIESTERLQRNEFHLDRCPELSFGGRVEPLNLSRCFEEPSSCGGHMNLQEVLPHVKRSLVITEVNPLGGTPTKQVSKNSFTSGDVTSDIMAIPTPSNKERERTSRKRKHLFDRSVVLSNKVLACGLHNTTSLVRVPRSVPLTALSCWKAHKTSNLHKSFLEPLTPCISSELRALFTSSSFDHLESKEFSDARSPSSQGEKAMISSSDEEPLFPEDGAGNPSTSFNCSEALSPSNSNEARFEMPVENVSKEPSVIESPDFWSTMMDEEIICQESLLSQDGWSVRTRTVVHHLHDYFSMQVSKQKEALTLSCLLTGRLRKVCARLFYETLVLKSEGYIDVTQESPCADIFVLPTPKMKAMF